MDLYINKYLPIDKFILFLFTNWLIIDSINGFIMRSGIDFPISQMFKLFTVVLVVTRMIKKRFFFIYFFVVIFYLFVFYINFTLSFPTNINEILAFILKPITSISFFIYFKFMMKSQPKNFLQSGIKILKVNILVFIFNILIGLFGLGYNSYTNMGGFGHCGYFYSINELSGVILVLYPLSLFYVHKTYSRKKYLLFSLLLVFVSVILATKTSSVMAVFISLLIAYVYGTKLEKKLVLIISLVLIICVIAYLGIILSSDVKAIQEFSYHMGTMGIIGALTSGRLLRWNDFQILFNNAPLPMKLLGLGEYRTVEMDIFDSVINCGYIGLFVLIYIYMYMIIIPCKSAFKHRIFRKPVQISNYLLILISIFSGHILFSSMAGMFIALSNSFLYYKKVK